MNLFTIKKSYLNYLKINHYDLKNYLYGMIIRMNNLIYLIPIYDYKEDIILANNTTFNILSNSTITKTISYASMIPIPANELMKVNKDIEVVNYIQKNITKIEKQAKRIYKQKVNHYNQPYLRFCFDYLELEKHCKDYELEHYNKSSDESYFITNSNNKGTSKYYLMNKDTKIVKMIYDHSINKFTEVLEYINIQYSPFECFNNHQFDLDKCNQWFKGRSIPAWREGLDDFLEAIGYKNKDALLSISFALSLSDQYWINPVYDELKYDDINFFTNDFSSKDYLQATFFNQVYDSNTFNLYSPNNTTDGMLKKSWIIGDDGIRYLLKGSYKETQLEPFLEVLASKLATILQVDHVDYTIDFINHQIVSKCPCFIDKNTELISAYSIFSYENIDIKKLSPIDCFNQYVTILESYGLKNVKQQLQYMFLIDYILINSDRHLGNFGVIRDVNTLKIISIAPIFDTGLSLHSQKPSYSANYHIFNGFFFNDSYYDFDILYDKLNLKSLPLPIEQLQELPNYLEQLMKSYQDKTDITDERIQSLKEGLKIRIDKLKGHSN